ncbi:hypothetical protein P3S68_027504 [Capsicum galapagoense]
MFLLDLGLLGLMLNILMNEVWAVEHAQDHSIIMLRKVLRHLILRLVKWKLMIYKQQLSSISNLGGQTRMCRMRDKPFPENLAKRIGHSTPWTFKHSEN